MNTTLVTTLNKHNVYYVRDGQVPFYIAVPYKDYNRTNICIEFYPEYEKLDITKNDSVWVSDEITRIYKEIDDSNISLVLPVFRDNKIDQTNDIVEQNLFVSLDREISEIINLSYKVLSSSNVGVDSKIVIVNNSKYANFLRWFLGKYNTRIEYKTYIELQSGNGGQVEQSLNQGQNVQFSNNQVLNDQVQGNMGMVNSGVMNAGNVNNVGMENASISNEMVNPSNVVNQEPVPVDVNQVASNNVGIVVGANNPTPTPVNMPGANPSQNVNMVNTPTHEQIEVPNASSGYVSYLLLGILTAVVSLVVLYIVF